MTPDPMSVRIAFLGRKITPARAAELLGESEADMLAYYTRVLNEPWGFAPQAMPPGGGDAPPQLMLPGESVAEPELPDAAALRLSAGVRRRGFQLVALHEYRDRKGQPQFWRIRCRHPGTGKKWIRPMQRNGHGYELKEPPMPRGIKLLYRPPTPVAGGQTIWIVEGEACADALALLGAEVYTSGAANSACVADWTQLAVRPGFVRFWPDNDAAGAEYAEEAVKRLRAAGCAVDVVDVAALDLPAGGDCVDWLAAHPGATLDDVLALPLMRHRAMPGARRTSGSEGGAATGGAVLHDPPERVPEGGRNNALMQLAGRLRRAGLDEQAIRAALLAHNAAHCEPPLPEREVETIARSVARYETGAGDKGVPSGEPVIWDRIPVSVEEVPAQLNYLHPLLPVGEVALLYGAGGSGKTYLALEWAVHLAAGLPWGNLPVSNVQEEVRPLTVLFVSMEDKVERVRHRVRKVLLDYAATAAAEQTAIIGDVPALCSVEDVKGLILLNAARSPAMASVTNSFGMRALSKTAAYNTLVRAMIEHQPDVVIIDNVAKAFHGDENDRAQVSTFIDWMLDASDEAGCPDAAILLLAHVNKTGDYSGSTGWHNACRSRMMLEKDEDKGTICLRHVKANHEEKMPAMGLVCREGLLVPVTQAFGQWTLESDRAEVLEAVRTANAKGVDVPSNPSTPTYCAAPAMLSARSGLNALEGVLARKEGWDRFWMAVRTLLDDGDLLQVEVRRASRQPKYLLRASTHPPLPGEVANGVRR